MTAETKTRTSERLGLFLRGSAFDLVLVLVASVTLAMAVSYAFNSAPALKTNVFLIAAVELPLLVILYAGSWSKRAVAWSAVAAVVYAIVVVAVFCALSPSSTPVFANGAVNDSEDSYFVFALVVLAVTAIVYLLSRRRIGSVVLLIGGVIAFEVVQFLYRDWLSAQNGTVVFLVGLVALIALYVFQNYRSSIYHARRIKKTSFAAASGTAVVLSVVCVGIGALVFFGVIAGLGLSTPQIKPFKDYFTRPVIEYSGNYERQLVDDPNKKTNQLSDQTATTSKNAKGGSDKQSTDQDQQKTTDNSVKTGSTVSLDTNSWQQAFQTISYRQFALTVLMVVLVIAALVTLVVLLWRARRTRRLKRIASRSLDYRIWYLYRFLVNRFSRLGMKKDPTLTDMEFAMANRAAMLPFAQGTGGIDFLTVTLIYQRACYDPTGVIEKDYQNVERFYRAFFKNARSQCGFFKWVFWRFWRL